MVICYRVGRYRWKEGRLQRKGLLFWRDVCLCAYWQDAAWAINCLAGFREVNRGNQTHQD